MRHQCQTKLWKIINVASSFEISIGETAELIKELMNSEIEITECKMKGIRPLNSEVNRLFGDNTLLKKLTKWEPEYAEMEGFKKGLQETIEWFLNPKNLVFYKRENYLL